MSTELDVDEMGFIELAKGPRRVATVSGAQFYGLPIGSVITKDVIDAIHAAKSAEGITPPKDGLSKSNNHGSSFAAAKAAASMPAAPAVATPKLKVGKSSLSGPEKFSIGESSFSVPKGSKLVHPTDAPGMAYVLTPDNKVHAFVEKGEIQIPEGPLEAKLVQKFSGDLTHDPHYNEEPFSNTAASYGISNLKAGDTLTDPEGNPQFVKQEDGTFKHSVLGATLEEKDLSDLYESGELVPQKDSKHDTNEAAFENSDAKDFKSMSAQDAKAALDGMAEGSQVSIDSPGQNPALLTKNADGSWNDQAGLKIESQNLAYLRSNMTVAGTKDKPAPKPEAPVEDKKVEDKPKADVPDAPSASNGGIFSEGGTKEGKDIHGNDINPDILNKIQSKPKSEAPAPEKKIDPLPDGIPEGSFLVEDIKSLYDAPTGSVLHDQKNNLEFTKKPSGNWDEKGIEWLPEEVFNDDYKGDQYLDVKGTKSSKTEDAPTPTTTIPKGHLLVTDPEEISDSSVLTYDDGSQQHTLTKHGTYWKSGDSSVEFYDSELPKEIAAGYIFMQPKAQVTPKAPKKVYSVGDSIKDHQDLLDAPSGIQVSYTAKGSGEKKLYTKTANGILAPSGVEYPLSNFKSSSNSGLLVIEALPDDAPAAPETPDSKNLPDANGYHAGDKITMLSHLTDMPTGSKITAGTGKNKMVLTKKDSGSWENESNFEPSFEVLGSGIKNENIFFDSSPEVSFPTSDSPEITFEPGGKAYSTEDLKAALDSLEAHTSSQVAYGLKSVKDGPLGETNNKDDQNHIVSLAQEKYPDLKPKPALVALLKDKLGIAKPAEEKSNSSATAAPKIHFGDASPKKTNFGLSGGDFTHEEIQNAIDTMEKFTGKNYLADLKNKGNPIGYLNDNALVGADKDKTVKKQKMIDLLKEKLGDAQSLQALKDKLSSDTGGNTNPPEELADWEKELLSPSKPDHSIGAPLDQSNLDGYDVGTQITTGSSSIYTKQEDGSWLSSSGTTFDSDVIAGTSLKFTMAGTKGAPFVPEESIAPTLPVDEYPPAPLVEKAPAVPEDIPEVPAYVVGSTLTAVDLGFLPSSSKIKTFQGFEYIKNSDGSFSPMGDRDSAYPASVFSYDSTLTFMPESVNIKKPIPKSEVPGLGVGSVISMHIPSGGVGADVDYTLTKVGHNEWKSSLPGGSYNLDDYAVQTTVGVHGSGGMEAYLKSTPSDVPAYALATPAVTSKNSPSVDDAPVLDENPTGLTPGKYSTATGKAYMIVKADGTGVYVSASGTVSALTPGKVTANHKAGLTTYHGIPDTIPELSTEDANTAKGKTKIPKQKAAEVNLPDGVYYLGNPKGEATKVYEVANGQVKIHEDSWAFSNVNHKAEFVPLAKIKTAYLSGKVLDSEGFSVVPEGYEGPLFAVNTPTNTHSLVEIKKLLDEGKLDNFWGFDNQKILQTYGFYPDQYKIQNAVKQENPDIGYKPYDLAYGDSAGAEQPWNVASKKIFSKWLDKALENVTYETPEGNPAAEFFDWSSDGTANKPLDITSKIPTYNYNKDEANAFVKAVQDAFGGKSVIVPVALNEYEKSNWIEHFKKGDFLSMYKIEVNAAHDKGKSHPEGFKHPGFPGNESTNKIKWAAAVPGETVASTVIPGNWSDLHPSAWNKDEVDNYIIAAHMQNPQYLSTSEKRSWVTYHKDSQNQEYVDKLSVTALLRKNNGSAPFSDAPVWKDDLKPSKSYDHYFDDTPYPSEDTWLQGSYGESNAWYKDNWEDPEVQQVALDAYNEYNGSSYSFSDISLDPDEFSNYIKQKAVGKYWGKKRAEYEAELAKPVYEVTKKIDAGSHDVFLLKDQFGRQYVFKPTPEAGKEWRTEQEHAASLLGKKFGFNTPGTKVHVVDEKYYKETGDHNLVGQHGLLMNFAPNKGSLQLNDSDIIGLKISDLTTKQAGQVAAEHVLDWIIDNDDTHGENMLIGDDGNLVGIDKGRGLFIYGNWDGLEAKSQQAGVGANSNMMHGPTVYNLMYGKIASGELSKEHADASYFAAMKAAKRIQKFSDAEVEKILREGAKNRTSWKKPHYMTSKEPAPQNVDELVAAFLERKSILTDEIHEMWAGIYKEAGLDLPETPSKVLPDEHISGWEEGTATSSALEAKVWGSAPIHASAGIKTGSSLLWSEKGADGEDFILGKFKVGELTQKKILDAIKPKANDNTGIPQASIQSFPDTTHIKKSITAAAKDASNKAVDQNYDADIQDLFNVNADKIESDLDYWGSDLTGQADNLIEFPSGMKVSADGLLQYKQMLDHYTEQIAKVKAAKENSETTNKGDFTIFTPTALAPTPKIYVKDNGDGDIEKYTELSNGSYLKSDSTGVSNAFLIPVEVQNQENGWSIEGASDNSPQQGTATYSKLSAQGFAGSLGENGLKTQATGDASAGHQGSEYEISLPTGEKIFFRNGSQTSTAKSQHGTVSFRLAAGDDQDASLARIQQELETLGLDLSGATEEDAENVYWRNMFDRLLHTNGTGASPEALKAKQKLEEMSSELANKLNTTSYGIGQDNVVEAIGLTMSPEEEHKFWNDLAKETYGADRVTEWISGGFHLPNYHHLDLTDTEKATGLPYWNRIDVDVKKLKKKNTLLAIGNNGKDNSLLNYIKSGGMISTEERLRILGFFKDGASSTSDQGTGGATSVFTRIAVPGTGSEFSGSIYGKHVAYWNPSVLAETGTYSFDHDEYGNVGYQNSNTPTDPMDALQGFSGNSNETMVQNTLSIFEHLEIMVFEDAMKRDEAIQKMKALGFETLRGLPIEERMVMREKLKEAMQKVKQAWADEDGE